MSEIPRINGSVALDAGQPQVITIEAAQRPQNIKLRVAAYARVSSSSEEQLNSFAAQNRYYTALISGKENWTLVDVYADEGITGTSAEKRKDFQRLLSDCRRGKVDRILVKSVSRFARNAKECLETVRELKAIGVSVYFEEQNIDTGTMSGELTTAMFAALAQAESESISGNMRWSYQKRMQSGNFITCKAPFGYKLQNGTLVIDEDEAEIIRYIFRQYLAGYNVDEIAAQVTKLGVPTRDGIPYWQRTTVCYVLRNEKYVGDALLQKRYSTDTFPVRKTPNHGEREKYYVTDSHQPIIERELFETVQALYKSKSSKFIRNVKEKRKEKTVASERTEAQKVLRRLSDSVITKAGERQVLQILNRLVVDPQKIGIPQSSIKQDDAIASLQKQMEDALDRQPMDEEAVRRLILALASKRYENIGNQDYETTRLQLRFSREEPQEELDADLLRQTVEKVLVGDGQIEKKRLGPHGWWTDQKEHGRAAEKPQCQKAQICGKTDQKMG